MVSERLAITPGGREGAPLWKITEGSRVLAYVLRQGDAKRILAALEAARRAPADAAGMASHSKGEEPKMV